MALQAFVDFVRAQRDSIREWPVGTMEIVTGLHSYSVPRREEIMALLDAMLSVDTDPIAVIVRRIERSVIIHDQDVLKLLWHCVARCAACRWRYDHVPDDVQMELETHLTDLRMFTAELAAAIEEVLAPAWTD